MKITIVKTLNERPVVTAEREIGDIETLVLFAVQMGVQQNFEEYVADFESSYDRTYYVGIDHAN